MKDRLRVFTAIFCCTLLTACQKVQLTQEASLFPYAELTPFATQTLTATPTITPLGVATETPAPVPTATPVTYTVKKAGETLFSIAANHGLTTDEIQAANPSVNPYLVVPGMIIIIPSPDGEGVQNTAQNEPASPPYPLTIGEVKCTPSLSGGQYCFAVLTNGQTLTADNVSAEFQLTNPDTGEVLVQTALVPLNRILSGGSLPIFAYFPPPAFAHPQVSAGLRTAVGIESTTGLQTAAVKVDDPDVVISANGLSVVVSGQARFEAGEGTSGKIRIAAVAYDSGGNIVGIRRFSSSAAYNIGELAPFTLNIYSVGGKIDRVELFGEINP